MGTIECRSNRNAAIGFNSQWSCISRYCLHPHLCTHSNQLFSKTHGLGFSIIPWNLGLSMSLSYNRDTLAILYYPVGVFLPITVFVIGMVLLKSEKWRAEDYSSGYVIALGGLLIATIMFPETRLSILGVCVFVYVMIDRFLLEIFGLKIPTQLFLPFMIVCIVTFFLSEHRLLGRSLARYYIVILQKEHISTFFLSIFWLLVHRFCI